MRKTENILDLDSDYILLAAFNFTHIQNAQQKTEVQTVILSKKRFKNRKDARKWIKDHDFKSSKIDETSNSFRFRQKSPDLFVRLRSKKLSKFITITFGPLKKKS